MTSDHVREMRRTYVTGPLAAVVVAAGAPDLMNLGWSPDPGTAPGSMSDRQERLVREVLQRAAVRPGDVVVDVGCGRLGLLRRLAAACPAARLVGVNVDAAQLPGPRTGASAALVVADAARLPLGAATVDRLVAVELLTHVTDKAGFWGSVNRVMRPQGRVVLAALTLARPHAELDAAARDHLVRLGWYFGERPEDVPGPGEIEAELRARGFDVVTEDISAGVFGPRHDDMATVLGGLRSPDAGSRRASRALVVEEWGADPDVLEAYLADWTARHALLDHRYVLVTAVAP
jgi:ubiquinone/menaquinone biosynthesis C-methylase UbiE